MWQVQNLVQAKGFVFVRFMGLLPEKSKLYIKQLILFMYENPKHMYNTIVRLPKTYLFFWEKQSKRSQT